MPTDPSQLAPDSVSISPQQYAATGQIAQNVASSSGSPPAPKPSMMSQIGDVGTKMLQAFAMARMGQDYVGQQLRVKYDQEAQAREFSERAKLAKQDAERDFIMKGVQQYGSQFLKNDKIMKGLDPQEVQMYGAVGQAVDNQKAVIKQAVQQLGLPSAYADLPPDQAVKVLGLMSQKQKNTFETAKQDVELKKANIGLAEANTHLQEAQTNLAKARLNKTDRQSGKLEAAWAKTTTALGTRRDSFIREYTPVGSGGAKYSEDQAIKSASAFNAQVRTLAKQAEKDGQSFDPNDYLIQVNPGPVIPGWISKDSGKRGMYTIGPAPSTNVPTAPTEEATPQEGTPKTGVAAAPESIKGRKVIRVPVSDQYPTGLKYVS